MRSMAFGLSMSRPDRHGRQVYDNLKRIRDKNGGNNSGRDTVARVSFIAI